MSITSGFRREILDSKHEMATLHSPQELNQRRSEKSQVGGGQLHEEQWAMESSAKGQRNWQEGDVGEVGRHEQRHRRQAQLVCNWFFGRLSDLLSSIVSFGEPVDSLLRVHACIL